MEIQYARPRTNSVSTIGMECQSVPPHMITRKTSLTCYFNEVFHMSPKGEFKRPHMSPKGEFKSVDVVKSDHNSFNAN